MGTKMANLSLAVDLYGCPNRCRHCWLGHMPNRAMEAGADEWIVARFQPYFEKMRDLLLLKKAPAGVLSWARIKMSEDGR